MSRFRLDSQQEDRDDGADPAWAGNIHQLLRQGGRLHQGGRRGQERQDHLHHSPGW